MSDDKKPADQSSNPSKVEIEVAADPEAASADPGMIGMEQLKAIVAALQADLDKKAGEVAEKHEQYLRAVAETENVRRRMDREKEETAKYAISKFAKDILSIGDNFQRAIAAVPKEAVETDPALKVLLDGVVLAERDYRAALERHGVKSIDPDGQPFNPHQHQAVMEREQPDVPTGTVLQVLQTGYLLEERCLRPAMVVVSTGGPKAIKKDAGNGQAGEPPSEAAAGD
jgi:molecular chaperone GrpE